MVFIVTNKEGFSSKKSEYIKLRNELIEQLKIEYPQMTDAEIFNSFKIYLLFNEDPHTKCNKSEFFFIRKMRLIEFLGQDLIGNISGLSKIWV